jgi:hypothetical protein
MTETHHLHKESWLDRHWYWLVIAVGVLFVSVLDSWHPKF